MIPNRRLTLYLSVLFAKRWLLVTGAAVVLVALLDSLANAPEIAAIEGGSQVGYLMARAPVIFDRLLLITLLLTLILTYLQLIGRRELVAITGAGVSAAQQVLILLVPVLGIAIVSTFVIDRFVPTGVAKLQGWSAPGYTTSRISDEKPLWLAEDNILVRISGRKGADGVGRLELFHLSQDSQVESVTFAEGARFERGTGWRLEQAQTHHVRDTHAPGAVEMWASPQTPSSLNRLIAAPRDLSLSDMWSLSRNGSSGTRPSFSYETWFWHRLTRPLAAVALLTLTVSMMQRFGRDEGGYGAMLVVLAIGFSYMIAEGVMLSLAEAGSLPVLFTLALLIGLLFLGGLYAWTYQETLDR
ncbi:MAG: LptF/LptG family permease [Pseudomonadota bacterium]